MLRQLMWVFGGSGACQAVLSLTILFWLLLLLPRGAFALRKYDPKRIRELREEVRGMFVHAYEGYINHAFPYDELRPLSCDGVDTWGSYSLTLIDALDTLAVMGNHSEFRRVADLLAQKANFDVNINVSVFETNIRVVGGLISAHLLSRRAGVETEPGWPCNGPLLRLAEEAARRLLPAFDTPTGMPYGTVNLRHGVPPGETPITCTAGVGTFILEFGTLSRLTGNPVYEETALRALRVLGRSRSPLGLVGNHVDVLSGRWTAQDAGIGAGVDSYYEYLVKGSMLLGLPELRMDFDQGRAAVEHFLRRDDWHFWVSMHKGQVTLPVFQSLEAYWPGVLSLVGDISSGMRSLLNYHSVWLQYGFTPEFYNVPGGEASLHREGYPLRPELVESAMYLYRATKDPILLQVGEDILRSVQHSAKTHCGYASVRDVRTHLLEDRMESFFLAETTKYLYLLFDPDNFLHNSGKMGEVVMLPWGACILDAGGYVFNTEAHPIDPAALQCCYGPRENELKKELAEKVLSILDPGSLQNFKGQKPKKGRERVESILTDTDSGGQESSQEERDASPTVNLTQGDEGGEPEDKVVKPEEEEAEKEIKEDAEKEETESSVQESNGSDPDAKPDFSSRISQPPHAERDTVLLEPFRPHHSPHPTPPTPIPSTPPTPFDPQDLLRKVRADIRNRAEEGDYAMLSCPARGFLQNLAILGEVFQD